MIIFFDWDSDGETDHVGIVQKVENGIVYTVEGNSGDSCRVNQYSIGNHKDSQKLARKKEQEL